MSDIKTQIGEIAYNPSGACFEALVTFHAPLGRFSVAASHEAPLSAEFDAISDGLLRDALAALNAPGRLGARVAEEESDENWEPRRAA
ncbi:hypothetical protein KUH32_05235 [Thalassococcus sp. CAU 1522]|uniref:DUF1488 domain-containing protein n=1 Tax=Thalassococcus arenae TaxID=2851652 RepID=A0ABS6N577_9RHOB|nr:hypothetical protein [Thalassococcus arenae]MBV2359164.1 hypothetical protein [Thalassococcus arenae]